MNNNSKARFRRAHKKHLLKWQPRVRPGRKGKVACLTYGKTFKPYDPRTE